MVTYNRFNPDGSMTSFEICEKCDGTGEEDSFFAGRCKCSRCSGQGRIFVKESSEGEVWRSEQIAKRYKQP